MYPLGLANGQKRPIRTSATKGLYSSETRNLEGIDDLHMNGV
jgi:hypothetical protein